ncbi:MAG: putative toxin-antitoxin system toxin component, PIN family [Candidatus Tectomicrobia bacterium]|uniref:Toxin-antitoxin system toxin component, PIN family n=1 Tax=Tectimicrobiota bacterium TaxID=2528274 RepID=A0A933LQM0_UNCTE|nr:putative toxin-antitoxin system toxin component, PIN family [Candidatus Tectomicrobia bacterium]
MPTVKAVIDTSVMVSVAFAKEGLARELRDRIADGTFTLIISKEIMTELYRVLHYPRILEQFQPSKDDMEEFIGLIMEKAQITTGSYSLHKIEDDPTDDIFLACALEASADYIVSRDPHLRNLKHFQGIEIISLKSFIDRLGK